MTTRQNPIITPATDETRREPRELSGVYANPDPETQVIDAEAEPITETWEAGQSPAPRSGEPAPGAELGTPHLPEQTSTQANERWKAIQAMFVDDPRKAVGEAHELVGELVQRIVDGFAKERNGLEQQWSQGDNVSTEDLRICLQNYRAFFSRLLPSANQLK